MIVELSKNDYEQYHKTVTKREKYHNDRVTECLKKVMKRHFVRPVIGASGDYYIEKSGECSRNMA